MKRLNYTGVVNTVQQSPLVVENRSDIFCEKQFVSSSLVLLSHDINNTHKY